jgi:F0F1-type ATP synthase membrane subunit c/vacuolar-type H+-ATPase subunit K
MALKLLLHTFRMIFGNFGQALKISVGPYVILFGFLWAVSWIVEWYVSQFPYSSFFSEAGIRGGFRGATFISVSIVTVFLFVTSWVAVSWHRFVLLEEYTVVLPVIKNRPIWPYVCKIIQLGLILGVIAGFFWLSYLMLSLVPLAAGGREAAVLFDLVSKIITLIALLIFFVVSLRMGVALVGAALGQPLTFRDAVEASNKISGAIWRLAILVLIFNGLSELVVNYVSGLAPSFGFVLDLALTWLTTMIGISILTTIYGHVIEDRPLVS